MVEDGGLERALTELLDVLLRHAPLTMKAAGVAVARLRRANLPADDDLIREVYGSADFRAGVASLVDRSAPGWTGR